jgi:hypothetical protein
MRVVVWLVVVVLGGLIGFVVGASPIGRGVFHALGGEGYDGWESMLTGPAGALLGMVSAAVVATLTLSRMAKLR